MKYIVRVDRNLFVIFYFVIGHLIVVDVDHDDDDGCNYCIKHANFDIIHPLYLSIYHHHL
ncbi:hypothetical protein DERF_003582 [Dermatophagoides farinae]|uniref:Uncharacterized protein n=1 Tax=Dermatophagoides farinae TaxID=6954 RepID=A0A922IH91_DERFA|nr:hypothetical protein DERF_003582 [Dermatophagoides farinae]